MITLPIPLLRSLAVLLLGLFLSLSVFGQAPGISNQPEDQSVVSGSNAAFSVVATGAAPLSYQWRLAGTNLTARTNSTLALSNVQIVAGGVYTVVVTNSSGAVTSAPALLAVDEHLTFRVLALQTNGAIALEHEPVTGDDRGGLVVTRESVYVTGDNSTARFSAANLTGGSSLGIVWDSLCSNLRTERIYVLGNGTNVINSGGGTVNRLIELDVDSGFPNGNSIALSTNIPANQFGSPGIFSGYDRIVIWNGRDTYDISLPSGRVTNLGILQNFVRNSSESWAFWGLAEYFNNAVHLIYVSGSAILRRTVAPNSLPGTLQQFSNLADMSSIGFSISRSRWYFHHEGGSQFRSGDETVGSAKALFTTNVGFPAIYQSPQSQINFPGETVVLSAVVGGNGPLSYQWRFNGTNIDGAAELTLVLSNVEPAVTGNYSLVVTGPDGMVVSGNAFVFIIGAPQILVPPQPVSALPGAGATFSATVRAAPPAFFQWRQNGTNIPNATNTIYQIPFVTSADAGQYNLVVTNRYGSVTSSVASLVLIIESAYSFRILALSNDAVLAEHRNITGDDRGGIAVSSNRVFVTGDLNSGSFLADDLSDGTPLPARYEALITDLRTERVYSLGTGTNFFFPSPTAVTTTLIEINGITGLRDTNVIFLSQPISMPSGSGLFAGYGQIVLHNGTRVYSIAVPSGVVADLGAMPHPPHRPSESWAYWGVAENFGSAVYLGYAQNSISIARTRVPDGLTTTIANFINLADMASIGASVRRGRWYFHHQGVSEFGGTNETVGYCTATYSIEANPVVDHYTWEALPGTQFAGTPFTATLTARSLDDIVLTNFNGQVSFAGFTTLNSQPVTVNPATSGNFSNGVWTGSITVIQPNPEMRLRASDFAGRFGLSTPFAAAARNDLAVQVNPSTNAATLYAALTYQISIINSGPEISSAVFLTNTLPSNVDFISADSSQGGCTLNAGTVLCDLGTMPSATSALVTITVVPNTLSPLTNFTQAIRSAAEQYPDNNIVTLVIPVALPTITISNSTAIEGNSAATRGTNIFAVQLNTTSAVPITVQFATTPGTASNTVDYVNRTGTLTFAPGVTATNVRVTIVTDLSYETDEFYLLNFSNAVNATLVRTQAVGTILNDDPGPSFVATNRTVTEGQSGTAPVTINVRLSNPASIPISVNYATSNGTAIAGTDYGARSGFLLFTNNTTNLSFTVSINGDTVGESNEFFYINFFNGTNITVNTQIVVTILNDDAATVLDHFTWGSIASTQGLGLPFTATLEARDSLDRTLTNYNGAARLSAGVAPTATEHIIGDVESINSFNGGPFTIGFAFTPSTDLYVTHFRHYSGTKVSIWNDAGVLLASRGVSSVNGTWTESLLPAPLKLTAGTTYRVGGFNGDVSNPWYFGGNLPTVFEHGTVGNGYFSSGDAYPTSDLGSSLYMVDLSYALSLFNFSMTPTNVVLTNGTWSGPVRVLTPGEDVRLFASDLSGLVSGTSTSFDVLLADDIAVQILPAVDPAATSENLVYSLVVSNTGPSSSTGVFLTNQLPVNSTFVSASLDRGTFTVNGNTVLANIGTLANNEVALLTVAVRPNGVGTLTNRARVRRNEAEVYTVNNIQTNLVTVVDLGIAVGDATLREGHSGTTNATFDVTLSASSTQVVSVAWATRGSTNVLGRGTAGIDFSATNGVLVFAPGTTTLTLVLPIFGDIVNEPDESFDLVLSNATNAPINRAIGIGTIVNDDPLPMVSASGISITEGRNGLTAVTVTLNLSRPSSQTVTVSASTLDGTASSSSDYVETNAFVFIAPGETTAAVTVLIRGDSIFENDETFFLNLGFAFGATLATAEVPITIVNDDVGAGVFSHLEWSVIPSPQTIGRAFAVTITARDGADAIVPYNGTATLRAHSGTNEIAFAPLSTATFTNGLWAGALSFSNAVTNVVLTADDGAGHTGESNPFDVSLADIRLSGSTPPEALIESPFNYTLFVSNAGPTAATAVTVTNRLSADVSFVSANSTVGSCALANNLVTCNVGSVTQGGTVTITIVLVPLRGGLLTNIAAAFAFETDPVLANNSVTNILAISGDEDADGLPDSWEASHGLSSSNPNDAQLDPDGDRHTNLQEYIAGTDPMDAGSVLKVHAKVESATAQISFFGVDSRRYVIEMAPTPIGPWTALGSEIAGEGELAIIFDPTPAAGQRFYRVRAIR